MKRAQDTPEVEHTVVGKHRFPLFSHPVFRAKAVDDRYVADTVEAVLQDPDLFRVLDAYVEQLLVQGKDRVSEDDIEALLRQSVLLESATLSASASLGGQDAPQQPLHQSREGFVRSGKAWKSTETRAHRLVPITADIMNKASPLAREDRTANATHFSSTAPPTTLVPTHTSKLLNPPMEPGVVSTADFNGSSNGNSSGGDGGEEADPLLTTAAESRSPSSRNRGSRSRAVAPFASNREEVVRVAVYSILHEKLTSPDPAIGVKDIARSRANQRAIDGQQLHRLPGTTYAALDMSMDGNSTCLRRRVKPAAVSPTQLTNILLATGQLVPAGRGGGGDYGNSNTLAAAQGAGVASHGARGTTMRGKRQTTALAAVATESERRRADVNRRGRRIAAAAGSTRHSSYQRGSQAQPLSPTAPSSLRSSKVPRKVEGEDQPLAPCFPEAGLTSATARDGAPASTILPSEPWSAVGRTGAHRTDSQTALLSRGSGEEGGGTCGGMERQITQHAAWEKALLSVRRSAV